MLLSLGRNLVTPTRASGEEVVPRYPHNTAHLVSVGDEVSPEQFIALVGKVGLAPGAHLHFEVRCHGNRSDPKVQLSDKSL